MVAVLVIVAGLLISWGSNIGVLSMDSERSASDRILFQAVSAFLIMMAITLVVIGVS